jgi:hypothetical protein
MSDRLCKVAAKLREKYVRHLNSDAEIMTISDEERRALKWALQKYGADSPEGFEFRVISSLSVPETAVEMLRELVRCYSEATVNGANARMRLAKQKEVSSEEKERLLREVLRNFPPSGPVGSLAAILLHELGKDMLEETIPALEYRIPCTSNLVNKRELERRLEVCKDLAGRKEPIHKVMMWISNNKSTALTIGVVSVLFVWFFRTRASSATAISTGNQSPVTTGDKSPVIGGNGSTATIGAEAHGAGAVNNGHGNTMTAQGATTGKSQNSMWDTVKTLVSGAIIGFKPNS